MKDYNLRSRDIYGDPKPRLPRMLGKLAVLLLLGGAGAAAYYWYSARPSTVEVAAPAGKAATPDIIPLALPPRRDNAAPPGSDKPGAAGR
jgi:hypothetical protein